MSPIILIFVAIIIISSIAQSNRQKKNYEASKQQKKTHPAFEADEAQKDAPPVSRRVLRPNISHTVKPLTESSHAHTESSITGFSECDPNEYAQPLDLSSEKEYAEYADDSNAISNSFALEFDVQNVRNGILYSEILGKPKALRRQGDNIIRR